MGRETAPQAATPWNINSLKPPTESLPALACYFVTILKPQQPGSHAHYKYIEVLGLT